MPERATICGMTRTALSDGEVEQLRTAGFTYPAVGSTREGVAPSGFRVLRRSLDLGSGRERFDRAVEGLLGWDMHCRVGLRVRTSDAQVVQGAVAVIRLGVGILGVDAPVRVVYVIDEPRRAGFAYGTLPGHPERGEEAFVVELLDGGAVRFSITAFSNSSSLVARASGPLGRVVQSWVTDRYLHAV